MFDSDLVETLAILHPEERSRFFVFLSSANGSAQQKTYDGAAFFCTYIFKCLDQRAQGLLKTNIWQYLCPNLPFDDAQLDEWAAQAAEDLKEILKTRLNKRIPASQKDLGKLIENLSYQDRTKLLSLIAGNGSKDKAMTSRLIVFHCQITNQYEAQLSDATVYNLLYGDEYEIPGKLPKSRTDTLKIVRKFIALEAATQEMSELQEWVFLQKFFLDRSSHSQYKRIRNNILKLKAEKSGFNSKQLYQYFLSENFEYDLQNNQTELTNDQNLWETIQSLDEYYLVERLTLTCLLLNLNHMSPLALPSLGVWLHINLNSPHLKWFFDKPLGQLFLSAIQILDKESNVSEQEFINYIQLLRQNETSLPSNLITYFEIFAQNHGIRRMNKGESNYGELVFGIQEHRVLSGRIFIRGLIKADEFQSIVTLGLFLNKIEWIKDFMEKNKKRIDGTMPSENYYQFFMARYLYKTKDLLAALNILMNAEYEDLSCKMASRILEIKVLCELELSGQTKLRIDEQLDARIEAGILFFFRLREVPANIRAMQKRFMDFMKKIIRAKENRRWKILEKIRKEIVDIDFIAERQWLLQITDQYLAREKK
jgi:hypothetical protein